MIVFESNPGKVVRLLDAAVQAQARTLNFAANSADAIRYTTQRSIVTRASLAAQVNLQFLHALGNKIYVYVFGDKIGSITLSGLAFGAPCVVETPGPLPAGATPPPPIYGAEQMFRWYQQQRASVRAAPVQLLLGTLAIEGFVVTFSEDVIDAASSLTQWTVNMAMLPPTTPPAPLPAPPVISPPPVPAPPPPPVISPPPISTTP